MTGFSRVRVLHLTTSFPLSSSSVSGIFIYRLVSHFPEKTQATVLTPDGPDIVNTYSSDVKLRPFRYAPKRLQRLAHEPGGLPAALSRSKRYSLLVPPFFVSMLWNTVIQSRNSDVIHAHWTINGMIAGIAGFITRTPVITTLRGEDVNRGNSSAVHNALLKLCFRFSDMIAAVSSNMYKDLLSRFPQYATKIFFVPNGVADQFFTVQPLQNRKKPKILVLGSLIPRKGVDLIIAALASIECTEQWELVIAGDGPEEKKLRLMVQEKRIGQNVTFTGKVLPENIFTLFEETDILVQASYREGRPNSVLEGMAAGVAVVGSNIDGINELIDNEVNGLLFPPGNTEELSKQLQLLIQSPQLRNQLGQAARQTIVDHKLKWSTCVAAYLELYQRLIKKTQN